MRCKHCNKEREKFANYSTRLAHRSLGHKGCVHVGNLGQDCLNYDTQRFRVCAPFTTPWSSPISRNMVPDTIAKRSIQSSSHFTLAGI